MMYLVGYNCFIFVENVTLQAAVMCQLAVKLNTVIIGVRKIATLSDPLLFVNLFHLKRIIMTKHHRCILVVVFWTDHIEIRR